VHFHGAAGEVTGSMHLVEAAGKRVLLDCGMQQGSREMEAANADPFPFDVASIDALVLSHAHIDHIGRAADHADGRRVNCRGRCRTLQSQAARR
jgi:metallo-beta-lactamase family protein